MPLTDFQGELARLLAKNKSPDSYLAGAAAIHFSPSTERYSNDLDYFQDSVKRVATAFADDEKLLKRENYKIEIIMKQPGFIRVNVSKKKESCKVDWAHDSAWRFMPVLKKKDCGYILHPVDLAINKILALVGRDEPRDFLDIMYVQKSILSLGALSWAAAGKDPGFTPLSLLELLRRRGKYRNEDFNKLKLSKPIDLTKLKKDWLIVLEKAEDFINSRPAGEMGCLYYSETLKKFIAPQKETPEKEFAIHFGSPGGILPRLIET